MFNVCIHQSIRLFVIMLCLIINLSLPQAHARENSPLQQQTILVVGDSISAGLGIDKDRGWVALLSQRLQQNFPHYAVVNASISGETSSGGANRFKSMLQQHQPNLVILELGGNDGLRGTPIKLITQNLTYMIRASQKAGAQVLLLGMRIPPNYGQRYSELFADQYLTIAAELNVPVLPFLLDGIAVEAGMMQDDGIHPTEEAQPIMTQHVWQMLKPML